VNADSRAALDLVAEGRGRVQQMRRALLTPSPEAVRDCAPDLERAIDCLAGVHETLPRIAECDLASVRTELWALRQDVREATALLHNAAGFFLGWARLVANAAEAYTPQGSCSRVVVMPRVLADA
jgi:hypothetical protein